MCSCDPFQSFRVDASRGAPLQDLPGIEAASTTFVAFCCTLTVDAACKMRGPLVLLSYSASTQA
jgi:hypothetical protein